MNDDPDGAQVQAGWQRRAADGAPVVRDVVEALIDGQPVAWDLAEQRGRTPLEQCMTRQVRAVAAIAAAPAHRVTSVARVLSRLLSVTRAGVRARGAGVLAALRGDDADRLGALAADIHHARSPREVAAALMTHVPLAIASPLIAVVSCDRGTWTTLAGALLLPSGDAAVTSLLAAADDVIPVDPDAAVYPLLPESDRDWLVTAGVATIVPLSSSEGRPLAGLLVGPRDDGRSHTRHDRSWLRAAANLAAVALGAMTGHEATLSCQAPADADLSFECETCGRVSEAAGHCPCSGRRRLAALPVRLHEAFEVQRRIGQGGMGVVYLARDLRLDRAVALKTLPCLSSGLVESIRAEARAMAALDHPQVAVLYGLEDWRGTPVLVVEYLPGGTLASRLTGGSVAIRDALAIGASIADALAALHERGWLHRDVKPSNIGFGRGGGAKLLDFGLTRWTRRGVADATRLAGSAADDTTAGALAGTPLYLSPDALDGDPPDEADDVWALSVVLVEMITGVHPFRASSREGVLARVRRRHPIDIHRVAPGTSAQVVDVLTRALSPQRAQRIVNARELAAALRALERAS